ncbi:unnamed protein product [Rotaria magnacalcarata]|uniref:Endonuclease/exonuclease/phosphatase domain-containing protein n=1 Tax=Rotaria magnacalcarata TaxID=392030 RepID=A0A815C475_9BILA|nr:unnamed protein product [Rotaria magnacalcarata]CAF1557089.1 unnamed protein product [Rotaria magnacalcarata]CAF2241478.1 unnamed protein product [Rotaria magnacalcarata]CAF3808948.1 unnamed protein product [Rotaria magnacalcarata]CAF3836765.1 unnamed protein product [Rotaria magnacalcarata]
MALARSAFSEWNGKTNKIKVINNWLQDIKKPDINVTPISILHYNVRNFFSNQCDLLEIATQHNPTIISLNELGTQVPDRIIKQLLFSYNIFTMKGTNPHGGVVLAIDKKLNAIQMKIDQLNIVAIQLIVKNQTYAFVSIYSPPNEALPIQVMSTLTKNFKNIIIVGDLNAKHPNWGCTTTNHKGKVLAEWLESNEMIEIQNQGMKTSLRSDTTIDLVLTTSNISLSQCTTLPYTGSDHLPIFFELNGISLQGNSYIISKTYWNIYRILLTIISSYIQQECLKALPDNQFGWFTSFQQLLKAIKQRVTTFHMIKQQRPTISPSLRAMLKHKHYLQNKYRHSKLEEDRVRLRSWNKLVQHELKSFRQNNWNTFISQVASPNPKKFWQTVKCLNKKQSCNFSAITENDHMYKTPDEIVNILHEHFSNRFSAPNLCANNTTDVLASQLWDKLSNSNQEDIELVCENSDLKFTTHDLK